MTEIISVRFKNGCKEYFFNPRGVQVEEGQKVVIETAKGVELATCTKGNTLIDEKQLLSPLRPMLRIATAADLRQVELNRQREAQAFKVCQERIAQHRLEMKLINVEYSFDGSKILFFFTAENRVDFRALVKDLASVFRTRIELRQVGVRDEAKLLGGIGTCGRPYCCTTFLNDFHPVSIKMAKTQNLSLNPTKISGACGRLMCCLQYEQDAYQDLIKNAPRQDSLVQTPDGVGTISQVNLLRKTCKVVLDNDPAEPRCYQNCDLCVIRSGKGKRPEGYEKPEKPEKPGERRERVLLAEPPRSAQPVQPAPDEGEDHRPRRQRKPRPAQKQSRAPEAPAEARPNPAQAQNQSQSQNQAQNRNRNRRHRPFHKKGGEGQKSE